MPSTDAETQLRRLMAVDYNRHNWRRLLGPNQPPTSSDHLGMSSPDENQSISHLGGLIFEDQPIVGLEKSKIPGKSSSS